MVVSEMKTVWECYLWMLK